MKSLSKPNKKPTISGALVLLFLAVWTVAPVMLGIYVVSLRAELLAEREKALTLYEIVNKFTDGITVIPQVSPEPATPSSALPIKTPSTGN